jgi:hypothetical protein
MHEFLINRLKFQYDKDECNLLMMAAREGDNELVKKILNLFHENENLRLISYLKEENFEKQNALLLAVQNGHDDVVETILSVFGENEKLELISSLKITDRYGQNALFYASIKGFPKITKNILSMFDTNDVVQRKELIKYLHKKDNVGMSALLRAILKIKPEIVTELWKILQTIGKNQETGLFIDIYKSRLINNSYYSGYYFPIIYFLLWIKRPKGNGTYKLGGHYHIRIMIQEFLVDSNDDCIFSIFFPKIHPDKNTHGSSIPIQLQEFQDEDKGKSIIHTKFSSYCKPNLCVVI